MNRFSRSLPHFQILCKTRQRKSYLKECPNYVIDDICEILYNVLQGKAAVDTKEANKINKMKTKLKQFMRKRKHPSRRKFVQNQDGGFLGAIIPIVASAIGALL